MNRLIIIGAGGHGKVIADNALRNGYEDIAFIDDGTKGECMGLPIIGTSADIERLCDGKTDFVIGIGNNLTRKTISEKFDVNWVTLIHPSAQIAESASVGKGTVVMAGAVVNACAKMGSHCIINSGAIIEHDNVLEDFVHISPGVKLGGTVKVGKGSHIGIGATVINNIEISGGTVVGAGAVVVRNITEGGVYVGIPAKKMQ